VARYKKDFVLYARPMKDGRDVWHYKVYDETGKRLSFSTGQTSKTLAENHCHKLLAEKRLIPQKEERPAPTLPTLREWAEAERWWVWGECRYLRGQLARSDEDKPRVSKRYADDALREMRKYLLPRFGDKRLDEITPEDCDKWLFELQDGGLSKKSVNNKASILRIMLGEAERRKKIPENPWIRVKGFTPSKHPKGILTLEEARKLLNPATVQTVWAGELIYYSASLLASVTGLRLGEILALKRADFFPDHVHVAGSWAIRYGLGKTKTKRIDDLPVPRFIYETIDSWCTWTGFVFSFQQGERPATGNRVLDALYRAIEAIGISQEERERRNVKFHSWRAFANTYMIGRGIAGAKVRELTRHKSVAMTEHYTSFNPEDFKDIAAAQESLVETFKVQS